MSALDAVIKIAKKHETTCVSGVTSNYSVTQLAAAEFAQMKQDYIFCRVTISDLEGQVEELRAALDEARKAFETAILNPDDGYDAAYDWLKNNPTKKSREEELADEWHAGHPEEQT